MAKKIKKGCFHLPEELLIEILVKLSVKSLLRLKKVCKSWLDKMDGTNLCLQSVLGDSLKECPKCSTLYKTSFLQQRHTGSDSVMLGNGDQMPITYTGVIVGGHVVMANGGVIAHVGLKMVALAARKHDVTFVVVFRYSQELLENQL